MLVRPKSPLPVAQEVTLPPRHLWTVSLRKHVGWKITPGVVPKVSAEAAAMVQQAIREHWSDFKIISCLQQSFPRLRAHFDDIDMFCTHLDCSGSNISALPPLARLRLLKCKECPFLPALPAMPRLQMLDCRDCVSLRYVSDMPALEALNTLGCPRLAMLPPMPKMRNLVCTNCQSLSMADNCWSEAVEGWIEPWQEQGLMPQDDEGRVLLWKCVSPEFKGNLGFQYELGQEFENTGMACAGPFGALKDYDKYRATGSQVMAIWATCLYPVNLNKGVFHVLRGTPAAVYLAHDITKEGFIPLFFDGEEDEYIESVLYGDDDTSFDPEEK